MSTYPEAPTFLHRWAHTHPIRLVLLSGGLLILAFPPFPFPFLGFVGFIPLLILIDQLPRKANKKGKVRHYSRIFRYTYLTFLIWNVGCCYWLMLTALSVKGLGAVLEALMAGFLANVLNPLLMCIPIYLYARIHRRFSLPMQMLVFGSCWLAFEWLHFNWDLSWSWITLGHSLSMYPAFIQYMEFTGIWGPSAFILLLNGLFYVAIQRGIIDRKSVRKPLGIATGVVLLPFLLNIWLLNPNRKIFEPAGSLRVRIIQPNVDPYDKFDEGGSLGQVQNFARIIEQPGIDTIDLVVLPETAIPEGIWTHQIERQALIQPLKELVDRYDFSLLTGFHEITLFETLQPPSVSAREVRGGFAEVYNATLLLRKDTVPQTFQKGKLVPFVERTPFMEQLEILKAVSIDLGGQFGNFGKPASIRNLHLHTGDRVASLVCYESEYGAYVRKFVNKGAEVMTIITNDGWWKQSSGHIQHAHFASLRAIESRREILRSANTGISLFSDNKGSLHQETDYWTETFIDRKINLYQNLTFYVKYGYSLGAVALLIVGVVLGWVLVQQLQEREVS